MRLIGIILKVILGIVVISAFYCKQPFFKAGGGAELWRAKARHSSSGRHSRQAKPAWNVGRWPGLRPGRAAPRPEKGCYRAELSKI